MYRAKTMRQCSEKSYQMTQEPFHSGCPVPQVLVFVRSALEKTSLIWVDLRLHAWLDRAFVSLVYYFTLRRTLDSLDP